MKKPELKKSEQLLKQFCEGYTNRDLKQLLRLFTKNSNMWGTGIDEYRTGIEQIEEQINRDWSQSDKGEINIKYFVSTPENSLWAAAICSTTITINGEDHYFEDLRATVVIEQEDGIWKIAHSHASFPDLRNPEGNSFPVANNG